MVLRYNYLVLFLFPVFAVIGSKAQAQISSYGELQAAYLYNFAKYITWPTETQQFVIGVFGDAGIMGDLEITLKGKKVRGKLILLKKVTDEEELIDCNIVYLSESNSANIELLIAAVKGKSVLIVTEEDLIRKGAAISFVVSDDRLKFKLKRKILSEAGLVASDGLLKLAILL